MLLLLLLHMLLERRRGTTGIVGCPPVRPSHPLAVVDGAAEYLVPRRAEIRQRHDQLVSGLEPAEGVAVAVVEADGRRLLALGDEPSGETVDVLGVGDRDEDVRLVVRVPERPHLHDEAHRATPSPAG